MGSKQKKILVVDDETDILEFLQDLLEGEGYSVSITNEAEYVEKLDAGGLPDLILIDVFLSGRDGRKIVKHLKSQEATRHVPVIMFSAQTSVEETVKVAGADDFVAKPFELDEVLAKIAKLVSKLHQAGSEE